jgi:hypothetical protein
MSNLMPLAFSTCLFETWILFVVVLSFFVDIHIYFLVLIFCHHWHHLGVFFLFPKRRLSLK